MIGKLLCTRRPTLKTWCLLQLTRYQHITHAPAVETGRRAISRGRWTTTGYPPMGVLGRGNG